MKIKAQIAVENSFNSLLITTNASTGCGPSVAVLCRRSHQRPKALGVGCLYLLVDGQRQGPVPARVLSQVQRGQDVAERGVCPPLVKSATGPNGLEGRLLQQGAGRRVFTEIGVDQGGRGERR